jgi:hypothetical protein
MNHSVIRYKTKPEATQENAQLVKDVFRELAAAAPKGVRYCVLQAEDGTFFHLVSYESKETQGAIPRLAAFQKFQENGEDRRVAPPEFTDVTIVGNYGVLAD